MRKDYFAVMYRKVPGMMAKRTNFLCCGVMDSTISHSAAEKFVFCPFCGEHLDFIKYREKLNEEEQTRLWNVDRDLPADELAERMSYPSAR